MWLLRPVVQSGPCRWDGCPRRYRDKAATCRTIGKTVTNALTAVDATLFSRDAVQLHARESNDELAGSVAKCSDFARVRMNDRVDGVSRRQ